MIGETLLASKALTDSVEEKAAPLGCRWRHVAAGAEKLVEIGEAFRVAGYCLEMATCIDNVAAEGKFRLIYHFNSVERTDRHRVRVDIGPEEEPPTLSGLFESANWYEREMFDMFGVRFAGHPYLVRILTAEDEPGHPLRKDFKATATSPLPAGEGASGEAGWPQGTPGGASGADGGKGGAGHG